jgi:heat shock protein HslJ
MLSVNVFLMAAIACSRGGPAAGDPSAEATRTARQLANATYSGIMSEPVTLTDGRWEGDPYVKGEASRPTVGLVDHFILVGDLNDDGVDEAATLLWESSGGSGTRLFLAVMGTRNTVMTNLATTLIGDRTQVHSGAIEDGLITLNIIRASPEDAACCPTEKALVTWALNEGEIGWVGEEMTGTFSLADLEGPEWVLVELGWEQPVSEEPAITLSFQQDKVSGNAGCNSYFAGVRAATPGELGFNGMGATRMACPEPVMDVERRYLKTLSGASRYSLLAGRLVLGCDTDEGPQSLVFAPRGSPQAKNRE